MTPVEPAPQLLRVTSAFVTGCGRTRQFGWYWSNVCRACAAARMCLLEDHPQPIEQVQGIAEVIMEEDASAAMSGCVSCLGIRKPQGTVP